MHTTFAVPGNSRTILTHRFGRGRGRPLCRRALRRAGQRRNPPRPAGAPAKKGRDKAKRTIASLKTVRRLRPARTEIIVCTGLSIEGGVQLWGDIATGLFCDRKQKG